MIYERELGDDAAALDAYREADRLDPNHPDVLDGLARLAVRVSACPRTRRSPRSSAAAISSPIRRSARRLLTRAGELAKLTNWDKAQTLFERARKDDPDSRRPSTAS